MSEVTKKIIPGGDATRLSKLMKCKIDNIISQPNTLNKVMRATSNPGPSELLVDNIPLSELIHFVGYNSDNGLYYFDPNNEDKYDPGWIEEFSYSFMRPYGNIYTGQLDFTNVDGLQNGDDQISFKWMGNALQIVNTVSDPIFYDSQFNSIIGVIYACCFQLQKFNGTLDMQFDSHTGYMYLKAIMTVIFRAYNLEYEEEVTLTKLQILKMCFYLTQLLGSSDASEANYLLVPNPYSYEEVKSGLSIGKPYYSFPLNVNVKALDGTDMTRIVDYIIEEYDKNINLDYIKRIDNVNIFSYCRINSDDEATTSSTTAVSVKGFVMGLDCKMGSEVGTDIKLLGNNDQWYTNVFDCNAHINLETKKLHCTYGRVFDKFRLDDIANEGASQIMYSEFDGNVTDITFEADVMTNLPYFTIIPCPRLVKPSTINIVSDPEMLGDVSSYLTVDQELGAINTSWHPIAILRPDNYSDGMELTESCHILDNFVNEVTNMHLCSPAQVYNTLNTIIGSEILKKILSIKMSPSLIEAVLKKINGVESSNLSMIDILDHIETSELQNIQYQEFIAAGIDLFKSSIPEILTKYNEMLENAPIDDWSPLYNGDWWRQTIDVPTGIIHLLNKHGLSVNRNYQCNLLDFTRCIIFRKFLTDRDFSDKYSSIVDKFPNEVAAQISGEWDLLATAETLDIAMEVKEFSNLDQIRQALLQDYNEMDPDSTGREWTLDTITTGANSMTTSSWNKFFYDEDFYAFAFSERPLYARHLVRWLPLVKAILDTYFSDISPIVEMGPSMMQAINVINSFSFTNYPGPDFESESIRYGISYIIRSFLLKGDITINPSSSYWKMHVVWNDEVESDIYNRFMTYFDSIIDRNINGDKYDLLFKVIDEYSQFSDTEEEEIDSLVLSDSLSVKFPSVNLLNKMEQDSLNLAVKSYTHLIKSQLATIIDEVYQGANDGDSDMSIQNAITNKLAEYKTAILSDFPTSTDEDQGMYTAIASAVNDSINALHSQIPSYLELVKDEKAKGVESISFKELLYANDYFSRSDNLAECLSLSEAVSTMSDLGWQNNDAITAKSNVDLSLEAMNINVSSKIVGVCCVILKSVDSLVTKAMDLVKSGLTDGYSIKIKRDGISAFNISSSYLTIDDARLRYLYPRLYSQLLEGQLRLSRTSFAYLQAGGFYIFFQRASDTTYLISITPSLVKMPNAILDNRNDYTFYKQLVNDMYDSLVTYNDIMHLISDNTNVDCSHYLVDLTNFKSIQLNKIENRAEGINKTGVVVAKSLIVSLGVAAGILLCCTGYGSVAGIALIAGATYLGTKAVGDTPEENLAAIERLESDNSYANSLIKSSDFKRLLQFSEASSVLKGYLAVLDALSLVDIYSEADQDNLIAAQISLVHCGDGDTIVNVGGSQEPGYLGYIPVIVKVGTPSFKYSLVTDSERRNRFMIAAGAVILVAGFALFSFCKGLRRIKLKKKRRQLQSRIYDRRTAPSQREKLLKQVEKTERKLSRLGVGLVGGAAAVTTSDILSPFLASDDTNARIGDLDSEFDNVNSVISSQMSSILDQNSENTDALLKAINDSVGTGENNPVLVALAAACGLSVVGFCTMLVAALKAPKNNNNLGW